MRPADKIQLNPGKRVLYLTKDSALIRAQLAGELTLRADELNLPDDLLDDINTDVMTPAWVCFSYKPEDIARDAYAGLIVDGERVFERDALTDHRGCLQCRLVRSREPIHARQHQALDRGGHRLFRAFLGITQQLLQEREVAGLNLAGHAK